LPVKKRSLSVLKNVRKSEKRRLANRTRKNRLRNVLKSMKVAKDKAEAQKLLPKAQATIDKSARKGIIHRNTASRLKAKLARTANKLA
jgi:small subunit ribosomal protein S20